jgi:hypothetical protein
MGRMFAEPGGFEAISRWLSPCQRATPPENNAIMIAPRRGARQGKTMTQPPLSHRLRNENPAVVSEFQSFIIQNKDLGTTDFTDDTALPLAATKIKNTNAANRRIIRINSKNFLFVLFVDSCNSCSVPSVKSVVPAFSLINSRSYVLFRIPGVSVCSLNPWLMAGIPPGCII